MIYSKTHGLLTIGDLSDIQAVKIENDTSSYFEYNQDNMSTSIASSKYGASGTGTQLHTMEYEESQSSSSDDGHQTHTVHSSDDNLYFDYFPRYSSYNQPQWRFLTELPQDLKWKTQRILQILPVGSRSISECLFVAGGLNMALPPNNYAHLINNNNILNTHDIINRLCNKAAIYNFNKSEWTLISDLNYARRNGKSYYNSITNKLFIGGGSEYDRCDIFEIFDTNKYNHKWNLLPSSIHKHQEKLSIFQNESISPSLLYCISKYGAEYLDLRSNEWMDLSKTTSINSVVQSFSNKPNISLTI